MVSEQKLTGILEKVSICLEIMGDEGVHGGKSTCNIDFHHSFNPFLGTYYGFQNLVAIPLFLDEIVGQWLSKGNPEANLTRLNS